MTDDPLRLDPETMRRLGYRAVDMLVDRLSDESIPPIRRATPDEMQARLGGPAPDGPQDWDATLMREGDPGDAAYLIADGELEVSVGGTLLATLGRCDLVGEIALIRGGARTATVVARNEARIYELDRETFLEAVGASHAATGALDSLIDRRLGEVAEASGRIAP